MSDMVSVEQAVQQGASPRLLAQAFLCLNTFRLGLWCIQ